MGSEVTAKPPEQISPELLGTKESAVKELAEDLEIQELFGLSEEEIKAALAEVDLSTEGLVISPQFQSPGFGDAAGRPLIKVSDLETTKATLKHELKHGLHYSVCKSLFEGEDNLENFRLFIETVLGDQKFTDYIFKHGNTKQISMLYAVESLGRQTPDPRPTEALSWELGALTYQHAFFTDPGMCEAVASFKDEGHLKIVDWVNHAFGAMVPGDQYLDGYGNKKYQEAFRRATARQKALLVKRNGYHRLEFFK